MKAAIYARVSTQDQNCEMQLRELREYCQRFGWEIEGEYIDTGWSGAKVSRPEFDRLMERARLRHFDILLVWKLDRFGRSVRHVLTQLEVLRRARVRFVAPSQGIDTDQANPASQFLMNILLAVAEFEREMIRDRVVAGMKVARSRGTHMGRPRRIFRRDEVSRLRAEGQSWRQIARALGVPVSTIRECAKTPKKEAA